MNWFSNHFWQLFDGIGGGILIAGVSWFITRTKKNEPAAVVANSALENAPVAAGSGNIQNVNAPVINVHIPHAVPGPPPAEPKRPITVLEPEPPKSAWKSPIIATRASVVPMGRYDRNIWADRDPGLSQRAMVIQFTNEARHNQTNMGRMLKASLVFSNDSAEVLRVSGGCWVGEPTDFASISVEGSHRLIVALAGDAFTVIEQTRRSTDYSDYIDTKEHRLADYSEGDVRVRLIDANTQSILYEGSFRIRLNPPTISPK